MHSNVNKGFESYAHTNILIDWSTIDAFKVLRAPYMRRNPLKTEEGKLWRFQILSLKTNYELEHNMDICGSIAQST